MTSGVTGPAPIGTVGIGGLGALGIQFAKALGHSVVVIDNRPEGRALAAEVPLKSGLGRRLHRSRCGVQDQDMGGPRWTDDCDCLQ